MAEQAGRVSKVFLSASPLTPRREACSGLLGMQDLEPNRSHSIVACSRCRLGILMEHILGSLAMGGVPNRSLEVGSARGGTVIIECMRGG